MEFGHGPQVMPAKLMFLILVAVLWWYQSGSFLLGGYTLIFRGEGVGGLQPPLKWFRKKIEVCCIVLPSYRVSQIEGWWPPCVTWVCGHPFPISFHSLCVSVSHFGNSHNLSNIFIIFIFIMVILAIITRICWRLRWCLTWHFLAIQNF